MSPESPDGDGMLTTEGNEHLAVIEELAGNIVYAVDHRLGRLVGHKDGGRCVDAVQVGLKAQTDVVELHVLRVGDDRLRPVAWARRGR